MDASPSHIHFVLLWLLCMTMFNSVVCSFKVHCNDKDMNTLLHFKQEVIDPSGSLSSWSTKQDCCQWTGVECDNITSRVTGLNLPCHTITNHPVVSFYSGDQKDDKAHCLTGELNLSLLELEFLSYLNLSNNNFEVIHYNSIGSQNSSNLHYLDLSFNYDMLLANLNWIPYFSSLQFLDLSGIDLHKQTEWLQSVTLFPSLSELHLESCQLQSIYPSLQYVNFTSLQVLHLANNDFISELPKWLFNLSCDISHIDLSRSHLHGQLSNRLQNLRSIKSLLLSENNLDGSIPDWLGQLEQIQYLDLSENSFSGPIPTSLGNLSSLIELKLQLNKLNGNLPESLGQLVNLEILHLHGNSLTGIVSERNLLSLSNLKRFCLSSPSLIFDFDPDWIPPFQLRVIWLGYVCKKLPSWLFTQTSLTALTIMDSNASFEPLDKFWNFAAQLEYLYLINNSINGDMSNVFLSSKVAWLESNNLRGSLPRLSPNVSLLNLNNNSFSGSISSLLCHEMQAKTNLAYLKLSENLLSGELTNCWNKWRSLVHIRLGNNNLSGKIPHSIGSLSNLVSFHLNNNNFFGEVPLSLKNCQNLWILNLGHNNFSGAIPIWIGQSVKALQLASNQFRGNIPQHICHLNSLMVLDFANNRLSGPIPSCLHNMTAMRSNYASNYKISISLQVSRDGSATTLTVGVILLTKGNELAHANLMYAIDLSSNNLSGTVPLEMFSLTRLQSLNLSHNQLVGTISEQIGNLKQLESIDLSSNRLSGQIPQSMSGLSFLGVLNLSFNNFMGKIPSGTQLQSFSTLSYMGNPRLCGPPLTKICPQDEKPHITKSTEEDKADDESEVHAWFYMGMGIGFAVGFWGVLGAIFFNRTCRHAYFGFLDRLYAKLI